MCTDRADFRSFDSFYDEATVAADPGLLVGFLEDFLFFDVSQESEVAFFVVFSISATFSNKKAILSKPSSRASFAKVGYISVHS